MVSFWASSMPSNKKEGWGCEISDNSRSAYSFAGIQKHVSNGQYYQGKAPVGLVGADCPLSAFGGKTLQYTSVSPSRGLLLVYFPHASN